jgi:hypothetical protein
MLGVFNDTDTKGTPPNRLFLAIKCVLHRQAIHPHDGLRTAGKSNDVDQVTTYADAVVSQRSSEEIELI